MQRNNQQTVCLTARKILNFASTSFRENLDRQRGRQRVCTSALIAWL